MARVVGIGFKDVGKIYWFSLDPLTLQVGDQVVVETIRGLEMGKVVEPTKTIPDEEIEHELKSVLRIATEKDLQQYQENEERAKWAYTKAKEIIKKHELEMKTLACEYTLDGSKLLIYYNADGRVDFRELVKDLAGEFHVRIELRQIGAREGAKLVGGIGPCGREICCKSHLREFGLVSMKMAKDQGMALSASKIAGLCGKLMCCIAYECEFYNDAKKRLPKIGDEIKTPSCASCKVTAVDYIREIVKTDALNDKSVFESWPASQVVKVKDAQTPQEEVEVDEDGIDS